MILASLAEDVEIRTFPTMTESSLVTQSSLQLRCRKSYNNNYLISKQLPLDNNVLVKDFLSHEFTKQVKILRYEFYFHFDRISLNYKIYY